MANNFGFIICRAKITFYSGFRNYDFGFCRFNEMLIQNGIEMIFNKSH